MHVLRMAFVTMVVCSVGAGAGTAAAGLPRALRWSEVVRGEGGEALAARGVDDRGRMFIVTAFSSQEGTLRRTMLTYVQGRDVLQVERESDPVSGFVLRWRTADETLEAEIRPDRVNGTAQIALRLPDGSQRFLTATGTGRILGDLGLDEDLLSGRGKLAELTRRFGSAWSALPVASPEGAFVAKTDPDCVSSCGGGCPQQCQDYCWFLNNPFCDICSVSCYFGCVIGCTS